MKPPSSGKPLRERLQVKSGKRLALLHAPASLASLFGEHSSAPLEADVVLAFATKRAELEQRLHELMEYERPEAILWLAYPKLSSPLSGDVDRTLVHTRAKAAGLKTVAQIAIDEHYTAMRLKCLSIVGKSGNA